MTDHEPIQLGRHGVVAAARKFCVDPILDRAQPRLVQSSRLGFEAHADLHIGEWLTPPQIQRAAQRSRCSGWVAGVGLASCPLNERDEAMLVDEVRLDVELIPGRYKLHQRCRVGGVEHLAHSGHPDLEHAPGPVGGEVRPELLHQPVGADRATVVDDEQREERPLFLGPRCDVNSVDHRRQRAKDAEGNLHPV